MGLAYGPMFTLAKTPITQSCSADCSDRLGCWGEQIIFGSTLDYDCGFGCGGHSCRSCHGLGSVAGRHSRDRRIVHPHPCHDRRHRHRHDHHAHESEGIWTGISTSMTLSGCGICDFHWEVGGGTWTWSAKPTGGGTCQTATHSGPSQNQRAALEIVDRAPQGHHLVGQAGIPVRGVAGRNSRRGGRLEARERTCGAAARWRR